jgi:signal transduction histidine kinase
MTPVSPSLIGNNRAVRYGAAILATALTLLLRLAVNPILGDSMPYVLFCPAVAFSAWYCGLGPSLLSTALALIGADYWILPPLHSLQMMNKAQVVGMVAFLCVSASVIAMGQAHRRARNELQKSHDELERRVKERTGELETVRGSLRKLTGHLLQLRDNEQRKLARELHDSVGQLLVAANINLSFVEAEAAKLSPRAAAAISESIILIQQTITGVRSASYLLHPPLLDDAGLTSALRAYTDGVTSRTNLEIDLIFSPDELGRLTRDLEIAVFRVVQEGLANVHRHSGSRAARVSIERSPEQISVEIQDHGSGMSERLLSDIESGHTSGVGIGAMRERVRELGGTFRIESNGNGTRVSVHLPIEPAKSVPLAS